MKSISHLFTLILIGLIMTSCSSGSIAISTIVLVIIIGSTIGAFAQEKKRKEEKQAKRERWRQKLAEEEATKELKTTQYEEAKAAILGEMGEPDKTIFIEELDINKEIRAYSESRKVVILGKEYGFDSILDCQCSDDSHVVKGQTTITSKGTSAADNGSMIGRAVVGGLVAGSAGAIIGGSTAKKNTSSTSVVNHGKDITKHNYTVWISVKDIANPLIQIPIGGDEVKANEIVSLMSAIIASK